MNSGVRAIWRGRLGSALLLLGLPLVLLAAVAVEAFQSLREELPGAARLARDNFVEAWGPAGLYAPLLAFDWLTLVLIFALHGPGLLALAAVMITFVATALFVARFG